MPNIKSAKKSIKTSAKSQVRNRRVKESIKDSRKALYNAIKGEDKAEATKKYREYCSVIDKAAKKGVIKKNAANRRKATADARLRATA